MRKIEDVARVLLLVVAVLGIIMMILGILGMWNHAFASQPPVVSITVSQTYPISMKSGKGLTPVNNHGVNLLTPVGGGWAIVSELGASTPMGVFKPAPYAIVGPAKKLTDHFAVGTSVLYKVVPDYDNDTDPAHLVGVGVVPVFLTGKGVNVALPVAYSRNFKAGASALAFTAKLIVPLP